MVHQNSDCFSIRICFQNWQLKRCLLATVQNNYFELVCVWNSDWNKMNNFTYFIVTFLFALDVVNLGGVEDVLKIDPNGYLLFCLCMGNYLLCDFM